MGGWGRLDCYWPSDFTLGVAKASRCCDLRGQVWGAKGRGGGLYFHRFFSGSPSRPLLRPPPPSSSTLPLGLGRPRRAAEAALCPRLCGLGATSPRLLLAPNSSSTCHWLPGQESRDVPGKRGSGAGPGNSSGFRGNNWPLRVYGSGEAFIPP